MEGIFINNRGGGGSRNKGWFSTPLALTTKYPVGKDGWFAIVGTTDTVWDWDSNSNSWIDSGVAAQTYKVKGSVTDSTPDFLDGKVGGTMKVETNLLFTDLLITDATVITNITDPTNRTDTTYSGPTTGLLQDNYYFDNINGWYYQRDGTTLFRISNYIPEIPTTPVIDILLNPVAITPTLGDRYLINGTGAGDFAGHDYEIATYNGATWDFTTMNEGDTVYNQGDITPANKGLRVKSATLWTFAGDVDVDPVNDIIATSVGLPGPTLGDRYVINTATPGGAFVGHAYEIAEWTGAAWSFTTQVKGQSVIANGTINPANFGTYIKTATAWVLEPASSAALTLTRNCRPIKGFLRYNRTLASNYVYNLLGTTIAFENEFGHNVPGFTVNFRLRPVTTNLSNGYLNYGWSGYIKCIEDTPNPITISAYDLSPIVTLKPGEKIYLRAKAISGSTNASWEYTMVNDLLISNATIISEITNPANWTGDTYTGSETGLIRDNYYYDGSHEYRFDGTTLFRINTTSGDLMTDITYADLVAAQGAKALVPGKQYRITDYQTVHQIYGTTDINYGAIEPIIVEAISTEDLSRHAISESFPEDLLEYDYHLDFCEDGITTRPGLITWRKDTTNNVECFYDWRVYKFRRFALDPNAFNDSGAEYTWTATPSSPYVTGDIAIDSGYLFMYMYSDSPASSPANNDGWVKIADLSGDVNQFPNRFLVYNKEIYLDLGLYNDYYAFNDGSYSNVKIGKNVSDIVFIGGANDVIVGNGSERITSKMNTQYFTIGNGVTDLFMQGSNVSITVEDRCEGNVIYSSQNTKLLYGANACVVGDGGSLNAIGEYTNRVILGNFCEKNTIGKNCSEIILLTGCSRNNIFDNSGTISLGKYARNGDFSSTIYGLDLSKVSQPQYIQFERGDYDFSGLEFIRNEIQLLTAIETATAGTYTINRQGNASDVLAFDADEATIQTAVSNFISSEIIVTGTLLTGITLEFVGGFGGYQQDLASIDVSNLVYDVYSSYTGTPAGCSTEVTITSTVKGTAGEVEILNDGVANRKALLIGGTSDLGSTDARKILAYNYLHKKRYAVGQLTQYRIEHTSLILQDGTIITIGGEGISGNLSSAEIYNYSTRTTTLATGSMTTGRRKHKSVLLPDGKVFNVGGQCFPTTTENTRAETFDPSTGLFTRSANTTRRREGHMAELINNGTTDLVLIAGGVLPTPSTTAELYNPATGVFTDIASPMTDTRRLFASVKLQDGKVLIVGGVNASNTYLNTAEIYDPVLNTFTAVANTLSEGKAYVNAILLADGKVLVCGGYTSVMHKTCDIYDPATGLFTPTGDLNYARYNHGLQLLEDNTVICGGGVGTGAVYLKYTELFDPATGLWTLTGNLNAGRYFPAPILPLLAPTTTNITNLVADWNSAETVDVTLTSGDGTQIPTEDMQLEGGVVPVSGYNVAETKVGGTTQNLTTEATKTIYRDRTDGIMLRYMDAGNMVIANPTD